MGPTDTRAHQNIDSNGASQYISHKGQASHIQRMQSHGRRGQHIQSGSSSQQGNQIPNRNGGGHHNNMEENNIPRMTQPTPLFERLVTEEVQELKAYARIIENQNRRLAELERVHGDLEARLELESRGRVQLETTLEEREREWAIKFKQLEADRDHWKGVVKVEQTKNARLIDQVVRKDQDIHRMLQRKVRTPCSVFCGFINHRKLTWTYQSCDSMIINGSLLLHTPSATFGLSRTRDTRDKGHLQHKTLSKGENSSSRAHMKSLQQVGLWKQCG
jgi:hypothetical protein